MRIVDRIVGLWRALFRSARIDADLADEMRFHVERETEANVARGMTPDAARRAARMTFGSIDAAQEWSRDDRPGASARQLLRDLRFGARLLAKSPIFAISAIAIVALGLGAATAVFSVVYGVLLRPLPYREPERLVSIWLDRGAGASHLFPTAADAADLRQLTGVFDDVAITRSTTNLNLVVGGEPRRLLGARVSPNLFSVFGVPPAIGRSFARDEDQPGHERVVLLSDALWRGAFGADSSIVGRQIQVQGTMHTIVGVMPAAFQYPMTGVEAWTPAVLAQGELARTFTNNYRVVARLHAGVTLDQARREVRTLTRRLASTYKGYGATMTVDSLLDDAVRDVRPTLRLLLAAVSFLLLIACVNLSNLFGARATTRGSEFAVRLALGASRVRVIAQAIAESVPVLALGGVVGVLMAEWFVRAFVAVAPPGLPRVESISLSIPVIAYSIALLVLTGVAASVAPAVEAWRSDFTAITKDGGRGATAGRVRALARRIGVATQIAFALPLLVGASLLIRSAINVGRVDLGFRPENVATWAFEVSPSKHATEQAVSDYYTRMLDEVRSVPGVAHAAITNRIPLVGNQNNPVHFENTTGIKDSLSDVDSRTVSPDYFTTIGVGLLAGRTFTDHDDASSPVVVIVDDRVARTIWPGEQVVGKRMRGPDDRWATIIGVVNHIRASGLEVDPRPQVYWSYRQWTQSRGVLAVRTSMDPSSLFVPVIRAVRAVDAEQPLFEVRTMTDIVERSQAQRRLTTTLMVGFGGLALLLAAVGIYGVVAYGVTQRMREFGIRVALGATRADVTRLVVTQGASMAAAGSIVGLVLALAASGLMRNLVYGVAPRDLVSLLGATLALLLVVLVASYIPARKAAAVDPGVTLRAE